MLHIIFVWLLWLYDTRFLKSTAKKNKKLTFNNLHTLFGKEKFSSKLHCKKYCLNCTVWTTKAILSLLQSTLQLTAYSSHPSINIRLFCKAVSHLVLNDIIQTVYIVYFSVVITKKYLKTKIYLVQSTGEPLIL